MEVSIDQEIGKTPIVQLKKVPKHSCMKCQIHTKLEFRNPHKSFYDRLALALLSKAEEDGLCSPDCNILFGPDPEFCFSLLNLCNAKKYKFTALVFETLGNKRLLHDLKSLGSKVHPISFFSHVQGQAQELSTSMENAVNLVDLLMNNPTIFHPVVDSLLSEIEGNGLVPDVFVAESDHYGILERITELFPTKFPNCEIFGVTSEVFSAAYKSLKLKTPQKLPDRNALTVNEKEAFRLARDLNRKEDLFCGERSGAVIAGALKALNEFYEEKRQQSEFLVLCLLTDNAAHSEAKFLNVDFMREKGYMPEEEFTSLYWWYFMGVGNLTFSTFPSIEQGCTLARTKVILKQHPRLLVWSGNDHKRDLRNVVGVVTPEVVKVIEAQAAAQGIEDRDRDSVKLESYSECLQNYGSLDCRGKLGELDKLLENFPFAIIYNDIYEFTAATDVPTYFKTPVALVCQKEMNEWIYSVEEHHRLQYGWEPGVGFMLEDQCGREPDPNTNTHPTEIGPVP